MATWHVEKRVNNRPHSFAARSGSWAYDRTNAATFKSLSDAMEFVFGNLEIWEGARYGGAAVTTGNRDHYAIDGKRVSNATRNSLIDWQYVQDQALKHNACPAVLEAISRKLQTIT